jgi:outer membrane protein TolC
MRTIKIHAKTQRREEGVPAAKPPSIAHIREEGSADTSSAPPPRLRVSARIKSANPARPLSKVHAETRRRGDDAFGAGDHPDITPDDESGSAATSETSSRLRVFARTLTTLAATTTLAACIGPRPPAPAASAVAPPPAWRTTLGQGQPIRADWWNAFGDPVLTDLVARDTVRLAIASGVASNYIALRALDQRLAVAQQTLTARTEALRIARRRAEAGYTSNLELHQAEAEYRATQQLVPAAQLAISRQENALSLLLGENPGAIPRGAPLDRLTPPPIPDGLPADLLRRRPDLFQAEQTLVAADRSLDSARAAMLPNIALTGSAGVVLSTKLADPIGVFSIGASILSPIFDGGRLRAQSDAATARRDQAASAYRRTALVAFQEVDNALAGVQRSGEQAAALGLQVDALAAALRNATNRYRAGYTSYIDQLDAQRGLLTAELALVQARADRLTAYAQLYQAMGGGWSREAIEATQR